MDGAAVRIRCYERRDHETLKRLTIESFADVVLDSLIEDRWPGASSITWGERKWLGTERDIVGHPEWCFVAEVNGLVVGFITTTMSDATKQGHVNDMAVDPPWRGQGIGRKLVLHALDVFRQNHLTIARIEALTGNAIGAHLYPSVGFELITTQNHYAMRLE